MSSYVLPKFIRRILMNTLGPAEETPKDVTGEFGGPLYQIEEPEVKPEPKCKMCGDQGYCVSGKGQMLDCFYCKPRRRY